MIAVPKDRFTMDDGCLIADASDLGLAPGEWPPSIGVLDAPGLDDRQEVTVYARVQVAKKDGEVRQVKYISTTGAKLLVAND